MSANHPTCDSRRQSSNAAAGSPRRPAAKRRGQRRRGAAVVEFAIVAPVFFMLLVGIIEVGRAMMVQQLLINASRVGARSAITPSATETSVHDAVEEYSDGVGIDGAVVGVTPDPASATVGTPITVNVAIDFARVSWLPSPWIMGGKTLNASSVMRKEGF